MSVARHHAEWLSLVDVSGPFLSMPVLVRVWPQGLDAHDPEHFGRLKVAFDEWSEEPNEYLWQWIRFVLRETLQMPDDLVREGQSLPPGLEVQVAGFSEPVRADLAIVNPEGTEEAGKPRVLVRVHPRGQHLDKPEAGRRSKASPQTAMMELLHGTDVELGLITNGEQWMLVHAPRGETTGFASWYASYWIEERITLQAFRSLLSARRLFGVAEKETIAALLRESATDQQEVTDQLGFQVRHAVEVLIQALDRIDKDSGETLLEDVNEKELYEAALTVMMRLVFLFAAEERGLLPLDDPFYQQNYAASTLREHLREAADQFGEEVLERRCDAWARLLATNRVVHGGVRHPDLSLPAYGGTLFDADRYPFLEGRERGTSWRDTPAQPLPVHNRTVLHLLEALQILQVRVPGGGPAEARRLSFRALDIEQIGHVYEGLLDHAAVRARPPHAPVLGLRGTKDKEPELPLPDLEELRSKGPDVLVKELRKQTGRSPSALKNALKYEPDGDESQRFIVVCDNDPDVYERVKPFAGLVRRDTHDYPVVIGEGTVYVTKGTDRRQTGTHYTPRSLTEPIVKHTLDSLVYEGPADGKPPEEWQLRPAKEILALKVCDMAMGSGAFLVETCRYLGQRLVEAWEEAERSNPGHVVVTPEGQLSEGRPAECIVPRDTEERLLLARRIVADRCLYGVDINPMAVEMAKLSLWLVTFQKDRPFSFLDHALKPGDSLVGITHPDQIAWFHLDPEEGRKIHQLRGGIQELAADALQRAAVLRRDLESFPVIEARHAEEKARLHAQAEEITSDLKTLADLLVGASLAGKDAEAAMGILGREAEALLRDDTPADSKEALRRDFGKRARELIDGGCPAAAPMRKPFHWALEFPEAFLATEAGRIGLHAIVGNPPFQGGQKITGTLGKDYREYLIRYLAAGSRGSADLCAYFFLRAAQVLRPEGGFGLLATNTIAQGDTREVGLERLVANGSSIVRAIPSQKWPGTANLEVAHVWVRRGEWSGVHVLEGKPVKGITPFLTIPGRVTGTPFRLAANRGRSFQGSIVLGMGFVLAPEAARALIERDPRNEDVLFPYLNGEDLNSRPDQSPSRWVINFQDWSIEKARTYHDCFSIVEEKVRPERAKNKRKVRRERWWQFAERASELYSTISGMDRVLIHGFVGKYLCFAFVPNVSVFAGPMNVFALREYAALANLQSAVSETWVRGLPSSLENRMRYLPGDHFETFPRAAIGSEMDRVGREYHDHRAATALRDAEGLTGVYNCFHDPATATEAVERLRELQVRMDEVVMQAYGWDDLELAHGFHETKQGTRFTLPEVVRREVFARLLELNHARYKEEVEQGLHEKKTRRKGTRKQRRANRATGQTAFDL